MKNIVNIKFILFFFFFAGFSLSNSIGQSMMSSGEGYLFLNHAMEQGDLDVVPTYAATTAKTELREAAFKALVPALKRAAQNANYDAIAVLDQVDLRLRAQYAGNQAKLGSFFDDFKAEAIQKLTK